MGRAESVWRAAASVRLIAFDVALDGRRFGEWFDALVEIDAANCRRNGILIFRSAMSSSRSSMRVRRPAR
jgi:hypothetical protein